jgi:hypothetical protein
VGKDKRRAMRKRRVVAGVASAGVLLLSVVACSNQTVRDLEGVTVKDPQKVELYVNVDQYPNISAICINGEGFATTTRDGNAAMEHIPAWSAKTEGWCGQ